MRRFWSPAVGVFVGLFGILESYSQEIPADVTATFSKNCAECHSVNSKNTKAKAKIPDIYDVTDLIRRGYIVPGIPASSILYSQIETDAMPEGAAWLEREPVSADDKQLIKNWIASLGADPKIARAFISDGQVLGYIFDDISSASRSKAKDYRYLTISHLYNNVDVKDSDLDVHRAAIAKMVNSLSWRRSLSKPVPIDPEKTIYRINLQQLGWAAEKWDRLADANPYVKFYDTIVSDAVNSAIQTNRPHMRADWFIEKVSQPPFYHEFADIPLTSQELERKLLDGKTADEALATAPYDVVRAGFSQGNSGVSLQNRMIERHHTAYGAFWRSFDFASVDPAVPETRKTRDFFTSPTGPGEENGVPGHAFLPDGGEIIFNLPNGLQAYMLVKGTGERIDRGPIEIVQDDTSFHQTGSREIINGISCIACHAGGMRDSRQSSIGKNVDELLRHVQSVGFPTEVREYVETLHRPEELKELWTADIERYLESLERVGVSRSSTSVTDEPVSIVFERFRRKVTIRAAAAELGFPEEKFVKAMEAKERGDAEIGNIFSRLRQGGIPRAEFISAFSLLRNAVNISGEEFESSQIKAEKILAESRLVANELAELTTKFEALSSSIEAIKATFSTDDVQQCGAPKPDNGRLSYIFDLYSDVSTVGGTKFTLMYEGDQLCFITMKYESGISDFYSRKFPCIVEGLPLDPNSNTCQILKITEAVDLQ